MSKFSQLLKMVKILETVGEGGRIKTKDLAMGLGVSPRMIRKYTIDIKEAGLDFKNKPGPKGGVYINKNDNFFKEDEEFQSFLNKVLEKRKLELELLRIKHDIYTSKFIKSEKEMERAIKLLKEEINENRL